MSVGLSSPAHARGPHAPLAAGPALALAPSAAPPPAPATQPLQAQLEAHRSISWRRWMVRGASSCCFLSSSLVASPSNRGGICTSMCRRCGRRASTTPMLAGRRPGHTTHAAFIKICSADQRRRAPLAQVTSPSPSLPPLFPPTHLAQQLLCHAVHHLLPRLAAAAAAGAGRRVDDQLHRILYLQGREAGAREGGQLVDERPVEGSHNLHPALVLPPPLTAAPCPQAPPQLRTCSLR